MTNIKKLIRLYEAHQYHRTMRYRVLRFVNDWVENRIFKFEEQDRNRLLRFMQHHNIPTRVCITQDILMWSAEHLTEKHRQPDKDRHFIGDTAKVVGFAVTADGTPLAELWADGSSFYTGLALIV